MATLIQFLKGQPLRPTTVIAGRNTLLIRHSLELLLSRLPGEITTTYFNAQSTPAKRVLLELGCGPLCHDKKVVVYEDVQELDDWSIFEWYAQNPTDRVALILTANSLRRDDGERWIPSTPKVLYIDCGNLTEDSLVQMAAFYGLSQAEATWLIDRCSANLDEILHALELTEVFAEYTPGLIKRVCEPLVPSGHVFAKYSVVETGNTQSIINQLKRRFTQLVHMSAGLSAHSPIVDLAKRADMEPFLAKRLVPVAKGTTPNIWLERLAAVIAVQGYAQQNLIGVREYLELTLK